MFSRSSLWTQRSDSLSTGGANEIDSLSLAADARGVRRETRNTFTYFPRSDFNAIGCQNRRIVVRIFHRVGPEQAQTMDPKSLSLFRSDPMKDSYDDSAV